MSNDIIIGSPQFKVILGQMEDAIGTVEHHIELLASGNDNISKAFSQATQSWDSPAADQFKELLPNVEENMSELLSALGIIHSRLKTSYQNYLEAEQANVTSLTQTS